MPNCESAIKLVCPECKNELTSSNPPHLRCLRCNKTLPVLNNVISFFNQDNIDNSMAEFYKEWQKRSDSLKRDDGKRKDIYKKLDRNLIYAALKRFFRRNVKPVRRFQLFYDYFNKRRDYFFEAFFRGKPSGLILDLGCGRGTGLFSHFGQVTGVDFNLGPLLDHDINAAYLFFIHSDALKLPFRDGQFDYVVSSDFLEHIASENKEGCYAEMRRVLKKGGQMLHFVTTDSKNPWFKFAHRYPDLFKKYLINEIGGHFGLELPSALIKYIEKGGFQLTLLKKMLWEPTEFFLRFNNEYKEKSIFIKFIVNLVEKLMGMEFIFVIINIPVAFVCRLTEFFMPLDYSNKLIFAFKRL